MGRSDDKQRLIEAFLGEAGHGGWNEASMGKAAKSIGYEESYALVLFPDGASEIADYYLSELNEKMLEAIGKAGFDKLKIRERIKQAILIRLNLSLPHKNAIKQLLAFYAFPANAPKAVANLATLSDIIWRAAGDTSTDFNYYTKRLLLSGVYSSTLLFWLNDKSINHYETEKFLSRRIDNVMQIQKAKSSISELPQILQKFFSR